MAFAFSTYRRRYAGWRWKHRHQAKKVVLAGSGLYLGGLLALGANFSLLSGPVAGLVISLSIFVTGVVVVVSGMRLHLISGYDDDGGHGGPGGLRPPQPTPAPDPVGGEPTEPSWWPSFEDEFRRYASERGKSEPIGHG